MMPYDTMPDDLAHLKTPPHSLEGEQSVLGGLMLDQGAWDRIDGLLTAEDFYRSEHRAIFAAIGRLIDAQHPVDVITLADALHGAGELDRVGGIGYLAELAKNTPSAANIRAYATAVQERAKLRALISIASGITDSAYDPEGESAASLIDSAQSAIMALGERIEHDVVSTNQALKEVVTEIDELYNSDREISGLPTGFSDIDKRTRGLQPADLIIIAGRPSMGKTTFAMNIAENVVMAGHGVLVFSMEMSRRQLMKRMLASVGHINVGRVFSGKLQDGEWPGLSAAVSRLKDRGLIIDDRSGLSIQQMRSTARKLHKKTPFALIVVDYLQLATAGTKKSDGRTEEVSAISRGLKAMAKELDVPVVALSQLNRDLEKRPVTDRRPRNSDLRDSGAIEQDADLICMLYRDEVYRPNDTDRPGVAEAIWTKFRNGETGEDWLAARLDQARFETLALEARPQAGNVTPMRKRGGFEY